MGRGTDDRSIRGHRHEIRQPTEAESDKLVELSHNIVQAHVTAENYLVSLYEEGVSQAAIADILGITQGGVHQRILRRKKQLKERRETGNEQRWYTVNALMPRPRNSN